MRIFVAVFFLAFSVAPLLAQPTTLPVLPEPMIRHFCGAPQLSSGAEAVQVEAIARRLNIANPRIRIALTSSPIINAWDVELSPEVSLICLPVAMVHFMNGSEGELAFILGHECGHAIDHRCKSLSSRARLADRTSTGVILAVLFGHASGDGTREQRTCENRADELGLNLITTAGYDPEDAVAALARLSILLGDSAAGPLKKLAALGKNHPVTPDRISHVRKLILHPSKRALP